VKLVFFVTREGRITKVSIDGSSGDTPAHKLLDFAAAVAIWQCVAAPGTVNGEATDMWAAVEYVWVIQ
jgi:hypothetical protein